MAKIIGLIGEKLAGKDTVAQFLIDNYGAENIRHSQILDEILTILDLDISRRNEIDLGMGLRQIFGEGILGRAVEKKMNDSQAQIVIINGIRFIDELNMVKKFGGKIAYVTAPIETRYERYLKRQQKADDGKQTFEQFLEQEKEPTEVNVAKFGEKADHKIINDGTVEELHAKIQTILQT